MASNPFADPQAQQHYGADTVSLALPLLDTAASLSENGQDGDVRPSPAGSGGGKDRTGEGS